MNIWMSGSSTQKALPGGKCLITLFFADGKNCLIAHGKGHLASLRYANRVALEL